MLVLTLLGGELHNLAVVVSQSTLEHSRCLISQLVL